MKEKAEPTKLGKQYAEAHEAHHDAGDLQKAFGLYTTLIAAHPASVEAAYSRTQVQNIMNTVASKQEIFDAQVALLSACFARKRAADAAEPKASS